uniref:Mitochondrial-processing peptidase subunit beta n=1 Tax=Sinocyclocheilus rhinocerous TaxID=307959 RepID=A0A673INJ1_9TELE
MSCLDLTITSAALAGKCTWTVHEDNLGSDHWPVVCEIQSAVQRQNFNQSARWGFKQAKWKEFYGEGKGILEGNIEEKYNKVVGEIISAANQSIPLIRGNRKKKKSVPWWSEECTVAIRERNKAFRILKRLITQDTVVEYQKKRAAARRVIKSAKRKPLLLSLRRGQASVSYAQSLLGAPETRLTTLSNGLRIASEETNQATCTVGLWIGCGSRYESEKNNGAGFFLEHMAFKGTKKHPQSALEQAVESMGAHLSAYTSREHTAYYMKTLAKDLPKAVELLAEVVQSSSLSEADIEQQRSVVLRELEEVQGSLQDVCLDLLHATAFQGTPLGHSVLGPSANARTLTRNDLVEYINSHYKAPRMVLATAGGVNHDELVGLAKQHFSGVSFEYEGDAVPVLSPCRFTGSEIRMRDDALPLAHIAIAVEGAGVASPDIVPLMVANSIIGSYDITFGGGKHLSSRLARLAAELNLCHSFQAFHSSYSDTGLLGIYFVTDKHKIEDMMHWAQNAWMNLCTTVTESDVARAKNALKASLVGQLNGTTPVCDDIGRHILNYGRRIPLAEWDARIEAVTPKIVRDVCSKYIYDKCPAVSAVGESVYFYI